MILIVVLKWMNSIFNNHNSGDIQPAKDEQVEYQDPYNLTMLYYNIVVSDANTSIEVNE